MTLPFSHYAKDLFKSFSKRGVLGTLGLLLPEVLFDLKHGTDTFKLVTNEEITDVQSKSKTFGGHYQGANPSLFRSTLKAAQKIIQRDFKNDVFIDYGCGKGRTLLMGAALGFKKVIGVEYSESLCLIAEKNIEIYKSKTSPVTQFQVACKDALEFPVPDDASVFFFFNPFQEKILVPVLDQIAHSLKSKPRKEMPLLIYMNPTAPQAFRKDLFRVVGVLGEKTTAGIQREVPDAILYTLNS